MNLFKDLGLSEELFSIIEGLKFTKPTEIQEKSIPHILKGKDVIGESATGSGKTLAFGCGIVEHTNKGEGLQSLVLTPTRELAEQVKESIKQDIEKTDSIQARNDKLVIEIKAKEISELRAKISSHIRAAKVSYDILTE